MAAGHIGRRVRSITGNRFVVTRVTHGTNYGSAVFLEGRQSDARLGRDVIFAASS